MVRFHLDESVAPAVAVGLRSHGVDVTTTQEIGLLGATDAAQIEFSRSEHRVLVTHDDDFLTIARTREHSGVCYCHQQKHAVGELLRMLLLVHACCTDDDMRDHVEFL
jgi:hypothetical protein